MRDVVSSGYPNTEKKVESRMHSGVFLTKFEVFGYPNETLSLVFDTSQIKHTSSLISFKILGFSPIFLNNVPITKHFSSAFTSDSFFISNLLSLPPTKVKLIEIIF